MNADDDAAWVADPSLAWRILLLARPTAVPSFDAVAATLEQVRDRQGWSDHPEVVSATEVASLRADLATRPGRALIVGLAPDGVVISAHHSLVDGQGLVAVLGLVTGGEVGSAARGVDDRPGRGFAGSVARRLAEVALHPPARIGGSGGTPGSAGEAFARREVPLSLSTTDLIAAVAPALGNPRHTAVGVGVARRPDAADQHLIRDRSALIRLRDVEQMSREDIRTALRTAPVEASAGERGGSGGSGAVMRAGLRLLAPRLGSTILVSHLGRLTPPTGTEIVAFHPVTAGGSGVSLGAVTVGETTTLALRARRRAWSDEGLERLLETLVSELVRR